jgi:hypothetical protein
MAAEVLARAVDLDPRAVDGRQHESHPHRAHYERWGGVSLPARVGKVPAPPVRRPRPTAPRVARPIVNEALHTAHTPRAAGVRGQLESRLGHDFARVPMPTGGAYDPAARVGGSLAPRVLRRKCACGGTTGPDGECARCKARRLPMARGQGPDVAPPIVHDVLHSPGRPLEPSVRKQMEERLGHDFSHVRVHTDGRAAASAEAVEAQAYTVGRSVVFGHGSYAPASSAGRALIAHELAHVVQQGGGFPPRPLLVGAATDSAEAAADRAAAGGGGFGKAAPSVQRKVVVAPVTAATQIETHLRQICPASLSHSRTGELSAVGCGVLRADESCGCVCDVIDDTTRTYTINVGRSTISRGPRTLFDGSRPPNVPDISLGPSTIVDVDPTIDFPDTASNTEFGSFTAAGTGVWAPMWRILAHELCGHGRLNQSYAGGTGNRPGHDATIDTENRIAAEHAGPPRGHFADPKPPGKQGESFFNPVGDRSKVVYSQTDGLHWQAP